MKYLKYILISLLILTTISISTYVLIKKYRYNKPLESISNTSNIQQPIPIPSTEEILLSQMSIEEKVGQLFIFGFEGTTLNEQNKSLIQDCKIGGILLLGRNISNENQLKKLIQDIQTINKTSLFISIDQEGGIVSRIQWNSTLTTPQSEILSNDQAYTLAKSRGEILKSYGINMNLAPVVEYITDPNSFMFNRVYRGTQPQVYEKGIYSIKGYTDSGIISVPKHYPGHSNTSPDSHYSLPEVNITNDQWNEYIQPFSNIIERATVDALMIGHIKYPNIDNNPSTISKEIINKRLVEDLKYDGLVISDDMEMDALENIGSYTNIAKQALLAGNDILIYSRYNNDNPSLRRVVYNYIVEEVKNGNMDIDDKVLKILKTKIKYGLIK